MNNCKICGSNFQDSPDEIVLCANKEGMVHLGCCASICSWDGKPCEHAKSIYEKISG
ncbi:hypothetical protein GF323_01780 [Candidatus Woesearchaeota archaeon]|nr:hypothetical protein [Candidatus Woesearchaeota archaeon]